MQLPSDPQKTSAYDSVVADEPQGFKCDLCDKYFKKREYLKDHLNIHAGRKRYHCLYCGEAFLHRASLARHKGKCHLMPV